MKENTKKQPRKFPKDNNKKKYKESKNINKNRFNNINNPEINEEKKFDDQIEGRNSVLELLESGKDINKQKK